MTSSRPSENDITRVCQNDTPATEKTLSALDATRVCAPTNKVNISEDLDVTRICIPGKPGNHLSHMDVTRVCTPPSSTEAPADPVIETPPNEAYSETVLQETTGDATIVQPVTTPARETSQRNNVAFIPATQHRAIGDATVQWNPGAIRIQKLVRWISRYRVRLSILALVFPTAIIVPFATLNANPKGLTDDGSSTQTGLDETHHIERSPINTDNILKCTLSEAATYIVNGKYEKARAAYRYLSHTYPDNRSFFLAASILETREEYK